VPLNKNQLKTDLEATMNSAKDNAWTTSQVAEAIAAAIDKYVRTGEVTGVKVTVGNQAYDQTTKGRVQ
jgi:hypothetical protein